MKKRATLTLNARLAILERDFPLIPHTGAGQLSSAVRRMKAEREMTIPIRKRSGFAISVREGKPANRLTVVKWERFYRELCEQLRRDYPDLFASIFPNRKI